MGKNSLSSPLHLLDGFLVGPRLPPALERSSLKLLNGEGRRRPGAEPEVLARRQSAAGLAFYRRVRAAIEGPEKEGRLVWTRRPGEPNIDAVHLIEEGRAGSCSRSRRIEVAYGSGIREEVSVGEFQHIARGPSRGNPTKWWFHENGVARQLTSIDDLDGALGELLK